MQYYSQNGEDYLLWSIFKNKKNGVFLDVGALDGLRFSNTYGFELAGWWGVCIEAHPYYYELCKQNRSRSIVVHAAATSKNMENIDFYSNQLGSLSTLDPTFEEYFKSHYKKAFKGFKRISVPATTIDFILKKYNVKTIDVVSIDVEGTEIDVLKGFTLKKYLPRILVIEAMHKVLQERLINYMNSCKYIYSRLISNNLIFCKNSDDAMIVKNCQAISRNELIHTDHPLKGKI